MIPAEQRINKIYLFLLCHLSCDFAGGCLRCTYSYLIAAYELISSCLIGGSDQFACQLV